MQATQQPIPDRTVRIELGSRSYDAVIGARLLARAGAMMRRVLGNVPTRAMIAADRALTPGQVRSLAGSLEASGFSVHVHTIEATEVKKSIAAAERLCEAMAMAKLERSDPVIALGGGIVGDLAGFAASMYRRGVPVVQCPTTLLSMVDAAIGGKTGANLAVSENDGQVSLLKNLVGAFHQPALVLADVETLATLPDRQLRAGLAECLKHALLALDVEAADEHRTDLFSATTRAAAACSACDRKALAELIARNVAIKAHVVAADEHERSSAPSGGRAALNLGHTFGHAIETLPHLSPDGNPATAPLLHGEAVALGLHAAARMAVALGTLAIDEAEKVAAALAALGLPTRVAGLPPGSDLVARMQHDKKVASGKLRLIVPHGLGRVRVLTDPPIAAVLAGWDAIRAETRPTRV